MQIATFELITASELISASAHHSLLNGSLPCGGTLKLKPRGVGCTGTLYKTLSGKSHFDQYSLFSSSFTRTHALQGLFDIDKSTDGLAVHVLEDAGGGPNAGDAASTHCGAICAEGRRPSLAF